MLTAKECPSGKMPVVIGNGWGGVLFHEACGHPLEASAVSRGLSCFAGKEGEMIASPVVSAVDDSTMNVLFSIERPNGEEILLPAHEEFMVKLEKKKRQLTVEVPEVLL